MLLSLAARVAGRLTRCLVTCTFATGGTILGAVVGVLAGFVSENGLIQGTLIGAISGAFIAMEVVDSLAKIWCCEEYSAATRARRMLLVFWNLVSKHVVMSAPVFPAMRRVMDSQLNAAAPPTRTGRAEAAGGELFERSYPVMGMCRAAVEELPVIKLTAEQMDCTSNCPICLLDFKAGESARKLPACCHIFHLVCIDSWLLWHAQCPMCRRPVYQGQS